MTLYDVYKVNVSPTAYNLSLIQKIVSSDMALFIPTSFLSYIFLMTVKLRLLIFLPKLNLSLNMFFYRYFQTQKLTFSLPSVAVLRTIIIWKALLSEM
jgi:hypothetical protein